MNYARPFQKYPGAGKRLFLCFAQRAVPPSKDGSVPLQYFVANSRLRWGKVGAAVPTKTQSDRPLIGVACVGLRCPALYNCYRKYYEWLGPHGVRERGPPGDNIAVTGATYRIAKRKGSQSTFYFHKNAKKSLTKTVAGPLPRVNAALSRMMPNPPPHFVIIPPFPAALPVFHAP